MQPCPTCGGMGIDANGYCTQCRTYRGLPQNLPSSGVPYGEQPYSGAPQQYSQYNQPTSGPSYGQPPTSGPGYGANPMSYPSTTYGGTYGAPTTPPPTGKKNSWLVPLLALSGVLVLLVVAIVVVVAIKNSGDDKKNVAGQSTSTPTSNSGDGPTSGPTNSLVDQCVVGTWTMTSYTEDVPVPQVGTVPFALDGKGATMKFGKDGKGVQDFGTGTNFKGDVTVSGQTVAITLKVNGQLTYDFRTNDGVMSYSNLTSNAKYTVSAAATGQSETDDFAGSTDPSKYTCSGDKMTMSTSVYQSELKKVSS